MAAAGADRPKLQALQEKRVTVYFGVKEALDDPRIEELVFTFARDGVVFLGGKANVLFEGTENTDDWNRVLSQGFGTKLIVNWDHSNLRLLRLGEPIFDVMKSKNHHPEWDGTEEGDFTITVVDEAGAKLAFAMALHPRLGVKSPLSLVAPCS